jgi:predicted secreted Zn-dependent protease
MLPTRQFGSIACALALALAWSMPVAGEEGSQSQRSAPMAGLDVTSFTRELPRHAMPHLPIFVGPASLELEGTRGTWSWGEVRFGVDEASLRVRMVPAGASCTTRIRLIEADVPALDAWFEASSDQSTILDSALVVGYARARLRIDSDCREWSVRWEPLPDPHLVAVIEERYYPVRGERIEELTTQVDQVRGRWAAYSEWHTSWTFALRRAEDGTGCTILGGSTAVHVSVTLPSWKKPIGVEPAVEARWEGFLRNLHVHEQGHVTIALQGAAAIDERLDVGFSAASCEAVREQADTAARRIFERYATETRRYDKETRHGLAQGTGLP